MNIATGFVRVTWLTPDLSATVERFRARLGFLVEEDPGAPIRSLAAPGRRSARAAVRLAGAEIELVAAGASAGGTRQEGTEEERLEEVSVVAGGEPAPAAAEHPNGASALAGIG